MTIRSAILGVGHYVPNKVVTNHDLAKLMPTSDEWIQQRTGIKERRFVDQDGVGASDLALPAAKMAIERAGLNVNDIDMIIFATLSPDAVFPGSGCFLGHKLGLGGVPALDVRNQCSGFLYSMSIADAWVRAGVYKNVLVVGAEVHSNGLDFSERGRDVSVLFGDGAGAAVVGVSPSENRGLLHIELHADGTGAEDLCVLAPASRNLERFRKVIFDEGLIWPRMNGKQVFRWAIDKMPEVAASALQRAEMTVDDIDWFIPHQANMRINQLVAMKLNIPQEKVFHNIDRYGNTTAATIPLCLSEAWEQGLLKEGTKVLSAAFGAGYTWGAAVYRF